MKNILITGLIVLLGFVAPVGITQAAVDYYIKIPGVDGESKDTKSGTESSIYIESKAEGGSSSGVIIESTVEADNNDSTHKAEIDIISTSNSGSGEKGGTADINIGVGELEEGGDPDEPIIIGTIPNPQTINTEFIELLSTDGGIVIRTHSSEKKGNVETEFKVEEGEKNIQPLDDVSSSEGDDATSSKPKEIVVVGSKVRVSIEKLGDNAPRIDIEVDDVKSDEDLALFATKKAEEDENIEEISLNYEKINMKYSTEAKLFGFLPIAMRENIEFVADNEGRVKVQFPWWNIFAKKAINKESLERDLTTAFQEKSAEEDAESNARVTAQHLHVLTNILKAKHETAKNAINNVR